MSKYFFLRIDWITLLIYLLLVLFGMLNIYSISYENSELSISDINNSIGKQFWFFIFCHNMYSNKLPQNNNHNYNLDYAYV